MKVVTRNDQLTAKAASKESRRQTIANNKKQKGLKKGKKGGKKKNVKQAKKTKPAKKTTSPASQALSKSPSKRKREILKRASTKAVEAQQDETDEEKPPRKIRSAASSSAGRSKKHVPNGPEPQTVKPAGKAKAKAKGKAKAKAQARVEKETPSSKSKAKPKKTAAKSKAGKGKKEYLPEQSPKLHDKAMIADLLEFARSMGGKGVDPKDASFKKSVRDELDELEWTRLNIYWSKAACGVHAESRDVHYFGWTTTCAEPSYVAAIAVKCAHMAVPCFELLHAPTKQSCLYNVSFYKQNYEDGILQILQGDPCQRSCAAYIYIHI